MKRLAIYSAALALIVLAASNASAAVIITNYPQANDNFGGFITRTDNDFSQGAGFTLAAGPAYSLDSVTLRLRSFGFPAASTIQVDLFGDSGGNPGGPVLVSFVIPVIPADNSINDVVFTPAASFILQPSTTYWLTATGSSPPGLSGVVWQGSQPGITPTGLAASAGYRYGLSGYPPTNPISNLSTTYQVNGTAVPEPSTFVMFGTGLVGLLGHGRRRRR